MQLLAGDVRFWLQTVLIAGLVVSACRWGAGPERVLSGLLAAMVAVDSVNHQLFTQPEGFLSIESGHIAIDVASSLVALAVAVLANRMYSLWFAAFQLIALFAHLAHHAAPGVATLAYRLLSTGPSYFQIMLLAGGIWFHRRRVARFGAYRSWRSSWPRLPARRPNSSPNA